jgi:hypothetical protein
MRALTRDQLLTVMGMTSGGFDAQQRAGYVALAFGSSHPAMPGRYCDLDLLGLAIANGLAPTLGRPTATTVTLGFFDQWVAAVGQADADMSQNYFFAMGLFGWNEDKKHPQEIVVTHGTSAQIMDDLRDAGSVIAVNITDVIARLRAKGRAAGIDLSQPFFFPPNHQRYRQIISEFEAEREARLARLRRDKKKWRHHNAFLSRADVKLAARLRDLQAQPSHTGVI